MYCEHCGKKIDDNAAFCPMCGTKQRGGKTSAGSNRSYAGGSQTGSGQSAGQPRGGAGMGGGTDIAHSRATACFVLGIISAASTLFALFPIAIVCGIIGLYYANVAKKCGFIGGIRTAGYVLSIIGIALGGFECIYIMIFGIAACTACAV